MTRKQFETTMQFRIDDELKRKLEKHAVQHKTSMGAVIREILRNHLAQVLVKHEECK